MNKINMSLYDHLKNLGIDKEHIYLASKEDPTDFPRKVGHPDEQVLDKSVDKQSHMDDIEEEE